MVEAQKDPRYIINRAPSRERLFSRTGEDLRLGIGIVTYNRPQCIARAVEETLKRTKHPFQLVVGDDGSTDETTDALVPFKDDITHLKCANRGVNANKNRLLYYFAVVKQCDVILILEDDSYPIIDEWDRNWIEATLKYGHINNAGEWFATSFYDGEGTVDSPFLSKDVSAQCAGFLREAISYVGYIDPALENYGGGHAEHSYRLARAGYGGLFDGKLDDRPGFYLIKGNIQVTNEETGYKPGDHSGLKRYFDLRDGPLYRHPWRNDFEQEQLWSDLASIA